MPSRLIRLRYSATCSDCDGELPATSSAWWDASTRAARCEACGALDGASESAKTEAPLDRSEAAESALRRIRVRYPGSCTSCGQPLAKGDWAWWERGQKAMQCEPCVSAAIGAEPHAVAAAIVEPTPDVDHATVEPPQRARPSSVAGGSAQREFERRKAKREQAIRSRHPRLGGLILAVSEHPQSTTAWAKGAEGERLLGASLDSLAEAGIVALHDRRIPGTKANIDHLAVAPSGVWVIDAKRYVGQVSKKDVGGWFSTDMRLYVGRRECTKLVAAMAKQVDAVRKALDAEWAVPVQPVLCFVDAEWRWFAKPFALDGVVVTSPRALRELLAREGPYTPEAIDRLSAELEKRLKPA